MFGGRGRDRPESGFLLSFLAKMDVKKDRKYRSKPSLAHISPDLGPQNAFIPKDVTWDSI